jgi:hypothetical protein
METKSASTSNQSTNQRSIHYLKEEQQSDGQLPFFVIVGQLLNLLLALRQAAA